jgi:hypothetical protein
VFPRPDLDQNYMMALLGPAATTACQAQTRSAAEPLVVAGQRIHVGIAHAGRTLDVEPADRTIHLYDDAGALLTEVPCTTTKSIARFKVRKPESPRRRA